MFFHWKLSHFFLLLFLFLKALLEAEEAYNLYKKEQEIISETLDKKKSRKPPPYKWIKVFY